jgi:cell volume regulation protein A
VSSLSEACPLRHYAGEREPRLSDVSTFGATVFVVSAGVTAALVWGRISGRLLVPAPAVFLLAAAVASDLFPSLVHEVSIRDVGRLGVVALIVILFDGGTDIGYARLRGLFVPVGLLGLAGTFATAGIVTLVCRGLFDLDWTTAAIVGAALAPTDPAVVFSLLGGHATPERASVVLQAEAGTNDPVAIALMLGLLDYATSGSGSASLILVDIVSELGIGLALGIAGGFALSRLLPRIAPGGDTLHELLTLSAAGMIYGAGAIAHGSGFVAVFVAGVVAGDVLKGGYPEARRFHAALANLAEIVVFVALGLTIELHTLPVGDVVVHGLILGAILVFLARPAIVALLLARSGFTTGEKAFIAWSGLRGAVPILLGAFALAEGVPHAHLVYGLVFVVVASTVVVQGSLLPAVAARLTTEA